MDFFADGRSGLAVSDPVDGKFRIIGTEDGGRSWQMLPDEGMPDGGDLTHLGEDASWLPGTRRTFLTVGESGTVAGSSVSRDGGRTWRAFSEVGFHTLDCTYDGACWAAGGGGRVGRL